MLYAMHLASIESWQLHFGWPEAAMQAIASIHYIQLRFNVLPCAVVTPLLKNLRVVVDNLGGVGLVETRGQVRLSHSQTHGVTNTLTQRACGVPVREVLACDMRWRRR
jgi:hypothetical protein